MNMIATAEEYLMFRRKLRFALHIEGKQLLRFARYAERIGHKGPLTVELALQWAKLSHCSPINQARRLDIVRRFARYLKLSVVQTEVPPEGVSGPSYRCLPPHIYSEEEVLALMGACRRLTPVKGLRPHTYATLFGLLACTGLRMLFVKTFDPLSANKIDNHIKGTCSYHGFVWYAWERSSI